MSEENDPILGGLGIWTPSSEALSLSDILNFPVFTWFEFIGLQLFDYCRRNPNEVVTMSMLHAQLKDLENIEPGLVSQSFDNFGMNVTKLTNIVHQLLKEGVPFVGLHRLIENISTYYTSVLGGQASEEDFDIADIVTFIRNQNKGRLLGTSSLRSSVRGLNEPCRVLQLTEDVENIFLQSDSRLLGKGLGFSREVYVRLRNGLEPLMDSLRKKGVLPVSIECPEILRVGIFQFLQTMPYTVPIVCEEELDLQVPRVVVGQWSLGSE